MAIFCQQFKIERIATGFDDFVDERGDGGKVNDYGALGAGAKLAVKIPKINAFGQWHTPLPFYIFAYFVLGRLDYAVAIFAFDIEFECFFHG